MLSSGLSIYNAKLLSANGNLAVLSSTHAAWVCDHAQAQLISLRLNLTWKARAWFVEQNLGEINSDKLSQLELFTKDEAAVGDGPARGCYHCHCQEQTGHVTDFYSAVKDKKD